jgi:undecaprenyl diphosphate synthase
MQHVAIIMDGNRRWARQNKFQSTFFGHKKGVESVRRAVEWCLKNEISYLSLYTFSLENLRRSEEEKQYLLDLVIETIYAEADELAEKGVKVQFVGDRKLFPVGVIPAINEIEEKTVDGTKLTVNILFYYGAQQELADAAKKLAYAVQEGRIDPESITTETLKNELWTVGIPDPDIVIRPGGFSRMSNFLLYQTAYSELFFLDKMWPDVTEDDLTHCANRFMEMRRNFGQ